MKIARFVRREHRALKRRKSKILLQVNEILKRKWDRAVLGMNEKDRLRLIKLDTWRKRYKVPLEFILENLLPLWWSKPFIKRFDRGNRLGIPVSLLTGPKSELILREKIKKHYPNDEQETAWKQKKRQQILDKTEDETPLRYKALSEVTSVNRFLRRYERGIRTKQKKNLKVMLKKKRQRRKYRDNPFL